MSAWSPIATAWRRVTDKQAPFDNNMTSSLASSLLRPVPYMGVIHVVHEAVKLGFRNGHPDWCNLGQGQPEIGPMAGAPERLASLQFDVADCAYGPVGGIDALRQAVADDYNRRYRRGKASQYTRDNVAIASGGRLALSRLLATLGEIRLGHVVPDYTAYEDLIAYHRHRFTPVTLPVGPEDGFAIPAQALEGLIAREQFDALLWSNPNNPTGAVVRGEALAQYVAAARNTDCWMLLDEFYSHFVFEDGHAPADKPVSAAEFVEDVERDPVVIVDGLTKNHRYPGLRVGWVVGPTEVIDMISRAASAIDGGPPTIVQRLAVQALQSDRADQETSALRQMFARKRRIMLDALTDMGVEIPCPGNGTFYLWGRVHRLPAPLNTADTFFTEGLKRKVMTVPGRFFDVNPGKQRATEYIDASWVRFSFGPPEPNLRMGLERLGDMVNSARRG